MKHNIIRLTSILVCLLAVNIFALDSCLRAATLAPTQEVDASGSGLTEKEAFKQAVVDAVRQVVGTLVTSENVVNNDKVIQDKILTVSNGFVEKVLKQDKKKLKDGTWVVNLKCIVRKSQLYGSLQKADVPTVKFDGTSLFADVVSQLDHQQSAVEMIKSAMERFSTDLVSATVLDGKPKIIDRNERETSIQFAWQISFDANSYFKNVAPALVEAFSAASSEKLQSMTIPDPGNRWGGQEQASYQVRGERRELLWYLSIIESPFKGFESDGHFKNVAPALVEAFSAASSEKLQSMTIPDPGNRWFRQEEQKASYQVRGERELWRLSILESPFKEPTKFESDGRVRADRIVAIPIAVARRGWKINLYAIHYRILKELPVPNKTMIVIAYFKNTAGNVLFKEQLGFFQLSGFRYGNAPRLSLVCAPAIHDINRTVNETTEQVGPPSQLLKYNCSIAIANNILPQIAEIELAVKPLIITELAPGEISLSY